MTAKIERGEKMIHEVKKVSFELREYFLTIREAFEGGPTSSTNLFYCQNSPYSGHVNVT